MNDEETFVYVGTVKCGCRCAVVVDMPDRAKETAKDVAEFITNGYAVHRESLTEFSKLGLDWTQHHFRKEPEVHRP